MYNIYDIIMIYLFNFNVVTKITKFILVLKLKRFFLFYFFVIKFKFISQKIPEKKNIKNF